MGSPRLAETDGSLYFTCREDNETLCHFVFDCPTFKPNFDSLWCKLLLKASNLHAADGIQISQFITNLDRFHKTLLLFGCLHLPFDNTTVTLINKFIASAVAKIYKIRTENLRELEALWLLNVSVNSKPDHPPRATPGDSHILVAPGVGFSLLCLAWGSAPGVLNQSKSLIILKKARFSLCLLNKWVAALIICLCMQEVSSVT